MATPDPIDRDIAPLLSEPFARVWAADSRTIDSGRDSVRGRLLQRLRASRIAAEAMFTARPRDLPGIELAAGVSARTLYAARGDRGLRPGEPLRSRLIELQAGARWAAPDADVFHEWLVLRGSVRFGDERLGLRDYRFEPAGCAGQTIHAEEAAQLFLRESRLADDATQRCATTIRDRDADWPEFASGIRRRVLWQHRNQAAMLYHAQAGAVVPLHSHRHDEECLMLQGELFLDDILLQQGDYQLAPAGTSHRIVETDTGIVIYAHGDLDLHFTA
ncbi:MAG: cupin domain-containing protein [Proteobacteria bacterium]|nr:cupin domain-containing protein [Pseudomonadota bacterium]